MTTSLIKTLSIDIETYGSNNLSKCGVYKYAENVEILLFAYSINDGDVEVVDLALGESIPSFIVDAIKSNDVIKYAFNAQFERVCLSKYLGLPMGEYLNPKSWRCTMIWSAYLGLPFSLKNVGEILNIDHKKLDEGKELIKYFCVPCTPTKVNGGRSRNLPLHAIEKWQMFKRYNKRDVEAEVAIHKRLLKYPVPDEVWNEYALDQEINDRGILIDVDLASSAIELSNKSSEELLKRLRILTNLDNPNSVSQLKSWLEENDINTNDLGKKTVKALIPEIKDERIQEVLKTRLQLSKTSVKKYEAMMNAVCFDNRARGMFQFYGANRTGRYSGRIIQLQNLPQNHLDNLEGIRSLVKNNDSLALQMLYEDIPDTLSQLIRTAFIPKKGCKFIVADFSSIEARVIAWYAHEEWKIKSFENGDDIYCATASRMFGVPVVKHGVNAELRQKGKVTELACGYGGSVGALISMGAIDMGLKEEELKPLVDAWRASNSQIVAFWWKIEKLIKYVLKSKQTANVGQITATYKSGILFITLPSKRQLCYVKPRIDYDDYGNEKITYEGVGATKKWERIESYGPKFVENIVQATARDILCNSMKTLKDYRIVAHVHDEVIIECPIDTSLDFICKEMGKTPSWCSDLNLRADGYECMFYQKD